MQHGPGPAEERRRAARGRGRGLVPGGHRTARSDYGSGSGAEQTLRAEPVNEEPVITSFCSACGAAASGRFCAHCGHALAPAAATSPAYSFAEEVPAATPTAVPRATPWWRQRAPLAVLVLTVLVLAGGTVAALTHEAPRTLTGTLALTDADSVSHTSVGNSCDGSSGYDDIHGGTQVVVTDGRDTTLATSSLDAGRWNGDSCIFEMRVDDVPDAAFYRVRIGNERRGDLQYSHAELERMSWSLGLSLG